MEAGGEREKMNVLRALVKELADACEDEGLLDLVCKLLLNG